MRIKPSYHAVKILLLRVRISEYSMRNPVLDVIKYLLRQRKIHIRNPQRKKVIPAAPFHLKIIFQTACTTSVHYFIEIVHNTFPLFYTVCHMILIINSWIPLR